MNSLLFGGIFWEKKKKKPLRPKERQRGGEIMQGRWRIFEGNKFLGQKKLDIYFGKIWREGFWAFLIWWPV